MIMRKCDIIITGTLAGPECPDIFLLKGTKQMFLSTILEAVMLVCFAAAWPASIYKSWVSRTRKGKSLTFMLIVLVGYAAGIAKVLVSDKVGLLIIPYTINTMLVTCDLILYYRNYRIDEGKASA